MLTLVKALCELTWANNEQQYFY